MSNGVRITVATARKLYWCDDCNESINPGTVYIRQGWIIDGEWFRGRSHHECYGHYISEKNMNEIIKRGGRRNKHD